MSTPSFPLRFVVSDLLRSSGEERRERFSAPADYHVELAGTVPGSDVRGEVLFRSLSGGLMAHVSADYDARYRCYRCLTEWDDQQSITLRELVEADGDADSDYRIERDTVDLEPILRDAISLALPDLPLCRPDCAGLCPQCGADLNTGSCPGHADEAAGPFAGLRDLLETQE